MRRTRCRGLATCAGWPRPLSAARWRPATPRRAPPPSPPPSGALVGELVDPNLTTICPVNKPHPRVDLIGALGAARGGGAGAGGGCACTPGRHGGHGQRGAWWVQGAVPGRYSGRGRDAQRGAALGSAACRCAGGSWRAQRAPTHPCQCRLPQLCSERQQQVAVRLAASTCRGGPGRPRGGGQQPQATWRRRRRRWRRRRRSL